jgi:hypothetical protein
MFTYWINFQLIKPGYFHTKSRLAFSAFDGGGLRVSR